MTARSRRAGVSTILWVALLVGAVVTAALLVAGWRPVVLLSDSMAPTAPAGSLLVSRPVAGEDVEVGDIITADGPGPRPLTHRVVAIEIHDQGLRARLQGDANSEPDVGRVSLDDTVLVTVAVVPRVGRLLDGANPFLWGGLTLLALSAALLSLLRVDGVDQHETSFATGPAEEVFSADSQQHNGASDPRAVALAATIEQFVDDGLDPDIAVSLARVRTADLLRCKPVETSPQARVLDDGGLFVLFALIDGDALALRSVPASSARHSAARTVVDAWWSDCAGNVPADVAAELGDLLSPADRRAGVSLDAPVEYGHSRAG